MISEQPIPDAPNRVSILARVAPALSYALPPLGAAVSAFLFIRVMQAMRNAEAAGIAAVAAGIYEANIAIVVTLYLAIFVGMVGVVVALVRMFTTITTASPAGWYFLITGILGLAPMLTLWHAQSLLLQVVFARAAPAGGVASVANEISLLLMVTIGAGLIVIFVLLASAFVPLPLIFRAKRKWAPFVMVLVMQTAIIVMTVLYHARTAWLYSEYQKY
jgi:hypothetical protein